MLPQRGFFIIFAMACILQAQGADKYTDENRPYEFGFKIDGEQHRHEKKDENGLIMGEFGFITADGVYHVTVYATDENGNFKILSMKNIRVKPYPTGPERQGHSLPFPAAQKPPQTQGPIAQTPPQTQGPIAQTPPQTQGPIAQKSPADVSISSVAAPARSCSHCSLPTTTTRKPILTDIAVVSKDKSNPEFGFPQNIPGPNYSQGGSAQNYPQQGDSQTNGGNAPNYPQPGTEYNQNDGAPQYQQTGPGAGERSPKQFTDYPQRTAGNQGAQRGFGQPGQQEVQGGFGQPGQQGVLGNFGQSGPQGAQGGFGQSGPQGAQGGFGQSGLQGAQGRFGQSGQQGAQGGFDQSGPQGAQGGFGQSGPQGSQGNPSGNSQFGPEGAQGPSKPTLISAQMQIVDKNTDIFHKNPGEQDGLPDGITKGDMQQLLYTFNYTVGFHGHFEEGYTNGAKQGYYFVTGRNGIRTRVDYVADEKGFRPKITQEVLDLLSEDVPKPETEKEEKYGLKGYEFKWLYYPVKSNSR